MLRSDVIGFLLLVLLALVPLAYASSPDPSWLDGWYDDGDYDDAILAVTSAVATLDTAPAERLQRLAVVIAVVAPLIVSSHGRNDALLFHLRAPPLAG